MKKDRWRQISRKLKKRSTFPERLFKSILEEMEIKFVEQSVMKIPYFHPIIVDFFLPAPHNVVFEIDGSTHLRAGQIEYDALRDSGLIKQGIRTFRFKNEELIASRFEVAMRVAGILGLKFS